jgi:predicted dienelactone hydrolase
MRKLASILGCALLVAPVLAQNLLPAPTGRFPVGRVTYHWVDSARPEPLSSVPHAERELMVDIWYPAETTPGAPPAAYLPDLAIAGTALGDIETRKAFGVAYDQVLNGRLTIHAQQDAPFSRALRQSPVLIFSHGLGVIRSEYTAQIEDLVSHGYVVVSVAHTYDTWLVSFPDGRVVRFDSAGRNAHNGSEAARNEYGNQRLQVWAADIRFILDQLSRYNRESGFGSPLAGRLDLEHIGALGHSDGGRAAALACQTDSRLRACMDLDGVADNLPFQRDVQANTMRQPFLLFVRQTRSGDPSDDALKAMGYTREAFNSLVHFVAQKQTDLLRGMPSGAYRLTLKTESSHMSFSDLPLLENADKDAAYRNALSNLSLVRRYTLAFFDQTLRGQHSTLLNRSGSDHADIRVEWFPANTGRR